MMGASQTSPKTATLIIFPLLFLLIRVYVDSPLNSKFTWIQLKIQEHFKLKTSYYQIPIQTYNRVEMPQI